MAHSITVQSAVVKDKGKYIKNIFALHSFSANCTALKLNFVQFLVSPHKSLKLHRFIKPSHFLPPSQFIITDTLHFTLLSLTHPILPSLIPTIFCQFPIKADRQNHSVVIAIVFAPHQHPNNMKFFSRTSSPLSLEPPSHARSPSSDAPPSPLDSHPLTLSSVDTDDNIDTQNRPQCSNFSHPTSTDGTCNTPRRRPRLRNGAPPFYQCWATVRQPGEFRRPVLRFCTVSGPTLRLSATPSADVLATSLSVFGATISTDEFPSWRIVIRTASTPSLRVQLFPDSRLDHEMLTSHLNAAAQRSITSHYTFVSHSHHGLFSRVCNALDSAGCQVNVKLSSKQSLSAEHAALIRREAILLLEIGQHEAIPQICDIYDSPRAYYIVLEGFAVDTLKLDFAKRGSFDENDVAIVIANLLKALIHLRNHGIVHRLISPSTICIRSRQQNTSVSAAPNIDRIESVQLSDFELAIRVGKSVSQDVEEMPTMSDVLRNSDEIRRSHAAYTPPEAYQKRYPTTVYDTENRTSQVGGIERDHDIDLMFAHDVWSVGMVMHWMLVGCTPFDAHTGSFERVSALVADARGMPVFSGPLWRGVSTGAKHLCATLLHADSHLRISPNRALQHPWLRL